MIYTLPHSVLQSALRFPDRPAFGDGKKVLNYLELANKMNQLANQLKDLGIKKGDRVGVYLNRNLETAIAIYGIMRAGAIYVPLDHQAPATLTRQLIQDCAIEILISHKSRKKELHQLLETEISIQQLIGPEGEYPVPVISWDTIYIQSNTFDAEFSLLEQDPAYIIYTSGSTGRPKGIVHTHYSGLSYARLTADLYEVNEQDRISNHAPVFFDISTFGYFTGPLTGAYTLIIPDAYTIFPASLINLVVKEKLTIWYSVPLALIQMEQSGLLPDQDFSSLRWVLYAGEAYPPKQLSKLMNVWSHARFSNIYGPAETNQCTYYHIPEIPQTDDPIPIGHIWKNTEGLIIDDQDQEIKDATPGELVVNSATMMQGYWQMPKKTERAFYLKKQASNFHKRYYRTGDLVKRDESGILHFLGRKDFQIKVRGYRVELGGIEKLLQQHEDISEAAAFKVEKPDDTLAIYTAVIPKNHSITEADLLSFLKTELPHYAIPERIHILKEFPRTGSGKINRQALKKQTHTQGSGTT